MLLNEEQYSAVLAIEGPIVVCAGAGSGKTRVIAYRVLHLINVGVDPRLITCVTFTNKAAREMEERIKMLCKSEHGSPVVTTFHGYALRLIRRYGEKYNIAHYTILGEDEQETIIKNVMKAFDIKDKQCTPKKILGHINYIKNNYFAEVGLPVDIDHGIFKALYDRYEEEKRKFCVFDFDDLLLYALKLLKDRSILDQVRNEICHLMIDEYQDTNSIQHELVKLIALDEKKLVLDSIFVVGDEDQSIYSWRGANVQNILHFQKDFPGTQFLKLTRNYRSTQRILSLANSVIAKNSDRHKKSLWTDHDNQIPVCVIEFQSGYQEAEFIIKFIKKLISKNALGTCAILYRSHYQSRIFEECCITYNVKYKVYGGLNFYQRQEIKDILSYLCLAVNQRDRQAFLRCCNTPQRGFGEVAQKEFLDFWSGHEDLTIGASIDQYILQKTVSEKNKLVLIGLRDILEKILLFDAPAEAISYVIQKVDYLNYIEKNAETENEIETRKENLQELITASKTFSDECNGNIFHFIDHLALFYDNSEEKNSDTQESSNLILLMSIHAAKGLEFSTVCIVGCEDGIFPSNRSSLIPEAVEEERRLLYVAITRAKERLICSHATSRALWGSIRTQMPSIFLSDFDREYAKKLSVKQMSLFAIEQILLQERSDEASIFLAKKNQIERRLTDQEKKIFKHPVFGTGEMISVEGNYALIDFQGVHKKIHIDFLNSLYSRDN
jgi:DNA helicase-2/ATP-dependent DNA helicase PcrA